MSLDGYPAYVFLIKKIYLMIPFDCVISHVIEHKSRVKIRQRLIIHVSLPGGPASVVEYQGPPCLSRHTANDYEVSRRR